MYIRCCFLPWGQVDRLSGKVGMCTMMSLIKRVYYRQTQTVYKAQVTMILWGLWFIEIGIKKKAQNNNKMPTFEHQVITWSIMSYSDIWNANDPWPLTLMRNLQQNKLLHNDNEISLVCHIHSPYKGPGRQARIASPPTAPDALPAPPSSTLGTCPLHSCNGVQYSLSLSALTLVNSFTTHVTTLHDAIWCHFALG